MRSPFGWSLPPGVSHRMIEEAYGTEGPCRMCGRYIDDCICPECHECGAVGDPGCYLAHGMNHSAFQIASLQEADRKQKEDAAQWDAYAAQIAADYGNPPEY